jgi:hypothetical protein
MAKTDEYAEARSLERRLEKIETTYQEKLKSTPADLLKQRDDDRREAIAKASTAALAMVVSKGKVTDAEAKAAKAADAPPAATDQPAGAVQKAR